MLIVVTAVLLLGLSTLCWSGVGAIRLMRSRGEREPEASLTRADVAVLIAARDEELVIGATLRSVMELVDPRQVFVVSDDSSDDTVRLARSHGARVMELVRNRGKARAIVAGLRHFSLAERFAVVMLLDADTRLSPDYFSSGLPLFESAEVVAVAGSARTLEPGRMNGSLRSIVLAYRERTYVAFQTLHKFGQAAARANAVAIVPGFASMYRSTVLRHIDIAAPGLAIEDYNMTFEVHAKRLGRVAFDPRSAVAYTQDPDTMGDYVSQMSRWGLGFWQTLMRHRWQPRLFWVSLAVFAVEVVLSSIVALGVLVLAVTAAGGWMLDAVGLGSAAGSALAGLPWLLLAAIIVVPDVVMSLYVAVLTRRIRFVVYAPAFPVLRLVDAFVSLRALSRAVRGGSSGRWRSPARRPTSGPVGPSGGLVEHLDQVSA
ncbi:glycosyltransferase [Aeromicrobium sp. CTD01-1L150]|uniref:glycosyltransferase n=1 Tax=Aeromicrobium sp. CTD01-1L150 TaxID=3341830 RepID=UPI0035C03C93